MTDAKVTIERELELIDGMIEVQLHHAEQCDHIANRTMAEKQKGWDMERVALLRKMRAALAALAAQPVEPVAYIWDRDQLRWYAPDDSRIAHQPLYTADQMRAYGDAVRSEALEQAAMIVQENAEHCRGPIRSILLANATAIRSAPKD